MKNVKDQVYAALAAVCENVSDAYPSDWLHLPAVQYSEEENKVHERTENKEQMSYVRFRVDAWDLKSTSSIALMIDGAISALGLVRTSCQDVADPSGMKHKSMRYEGIIDMNSDYVYWNQI